ncbi:MAG: Lrp/AsnC family transcriptional regulator [Dehalococcoidia bacterium]|jgi:Lrp/AsnC family leucine-responsive transcriptional regulator
MFIMNGHMDKIDDINKKLIYYLEQDADQSSQVLGNKLGISATSVRRRIRDLKKRGILHLMGIVDAEKAGFMFPIIFLIDAEHNKIESVSKALAKYDQIISVSRFTGRYPIIAVAVFKRHTEISDFIMSVSKNVVGFTQIETLVCLRQVKGHYTLI